MGLSAPGLVGVLVDPPVLLIDVAAVIAGQVALTPGDVNDRKARAIATSLMCWNSCMIGNDQMPLSRSVLRVPTPPILLTWTIVDDVVHDQQRSKIWCTLFCRRCRG
jgi:hypothetical protein